MFSNLDCFPCVVRMATEAVKQCGKSEETQFEIMKEVLSSLSGLDINKNSSSEMIYHAFKMIRELGDIHDPLENYKSYCVDVALRAYPELKHTVETSDDRFSTAVRIAMAGNIIDHSRENMRDNLALFTSIEEALSKPLTIDHIDQLRTEIDKSEKILYLADNAGETVFDRILIEEMPTERITYSVKGQPVSNDATRRDAQMAGLTEIVKVIDDGSDYPCVNLDKCTPEFKKVFNEADLVISKGQGNYKALKDMQRNIFILARVRCRVTAHQFRLSVGDFIVRGLEIENGSIPD